MILLLSHARDSQKEAAGISAGAIDETSLSFSQAIWREIEEELLGRFGPPKSSVVKDILTGFKSEFRMQDLEARIRHLSKFDASVGTFFGSQQNIVELCRALYSLGAIGNVYFVEGRKQKEPRDRWSFRRFAEPTLDNEFVVHESLRKSLQISFSGIRPHRTS